MNNESQVDFGGISFKIQPDARTIEEVKRECRQHILALKEKEKELTRLRARVKELEEKLAVSDLAVDLAEPFEMDLQARIRELEEAMPDPIKIRELGKAGTCGTGYVKYWTDACEIASRIQAVMRKGDG